MDNQKFDLILDRLLERTKEGKLEWKATANESTLLTVLTDSSVSVNYEANEYEGFEYYTFDFRNENGETVASITVTDLTDQKEEFEKAEKIYHLARQDSFLNNKVVDRILEQLAA